MTNIEIANNFQECIKREKEHIELCKELYGVNSKKYKEEVIILKGIIRALNYFIANYDIFNNEDE